MAELLINMFQELILHIASLYYQRKIQKDSYTGYQKQPMVDMKQLHILLDYTIILN